MSAFTKSNRSQLVVGKDLDNNILPALFGPHELNPIKNITPKNRISFFIREI
jgi:hypothetical protein